MALVFASTNKVYGSMEDIAFERQGKRYAYVDYPKGADEKCPLDFHYFENGITLTGISLLQAPCEHFWGVFFLVN